MVMLAEAFLHYFPWKMLLKGKELPRVAAYVFGVLGMMCPFTAWLWYHNNWKVIEGMWIAIVAGGISVMALYGFDHYLELYMRDIEASEREHAKK